MKKTKAVCGVVDWKRGCRLVGPRSLRSLRLTGLLFLCLLLGGLSVGVCLAAPEVGGQDAGIDGTSDGPNDAPSDGTSDATSDGAVDDAIDSATDGTGGEIGPATRATIDAEPARPALQVDLQVPIRLLQMIERGAATDSELDSWLALPGNREIIERGIPVEHLRRNADDVVRGVATELRQPLGRPGTLRMEPLDAWQRSLEWLETQGEGLASGALTHVLRFTSTQSGPERIRIVFHLGGGWDARTSDAIYVNLTRFMDTVQPDLDGIEALIARELMQVYLATGPEDFVDFGSPEAALLTGLQQMMNEGLTRFVQRRALRSVYPEGSFAADLVREYADVDREIPDRMQALDRFSAKALTGDAAAAESLLVEGLRSGTLPAIGDLVCRTLFARGGATVLAAYPQCGPATLLAAYREIAVTRDDLPDLPIGMARHLESIAAGPERTWLQVEQGRRQAFAALDLKDFPAALEPLRRVVDLMPGNPVDTYNLACVLSMIGETDEAMQLLLDAVDYGFRNGIHIRNDPDLGPLHRRAEFQALLERLGAGDPLPPDQGEEPPVDEGGSNREPDGEAGYRG